MANVGSRADVGRNSRTWTRVIPIEGVCVGWAGGISTVSLIFSS